jgi:hypothetical protein
MRAIFAMGTGEEKVKAVYGCQIRGSDQIV